MPLFRVHTQDGQTGYAESDSPDAFLKDAQKQGYQVEEIERWSLRDPANPKAVGMAEVPIGQQEEAQADWKAKGWTAQKIYPIDPLPTSGPAVALDMLKKLVTPQPKPVGNYFVREKPISEEEVRAAAKRNKITEDSVWAMLQKEPQAISLDDLIGRNKVSYPAQVASTAVKAGPDAAAALARSSAATAVLKPRASLVNALSGKTYEEFAQHIAASEEQDALAANNPAMRLMAGAQRRPSLGLTLSAGTGGKSPYEQAKAQAAEASRQQLGSDRLPANPADWPVTPRDIAMSGWAEQVGADREQLAAMQTKQKKLASTIRSATPEQVQWAATYGQTQKHSLLGQAVLDFAQNWPNQAAAVGGQALNSVAPGAGGAAAFGFMAAQEEADYMQQADALGIPTQYSSEYAKKYALAAGAIEYAEQIVNMSGLGIAGKGSKTAAAGLRQKILKNAGALLKDMGIEGLEEVSQQALQYKILAKMVQDYGAKTGTPVKIPANLPLDEDGNVMWSKARYDLARSFQAGAGVAGLSHAGGAVAQAPGMAKEAFQKRLRLANEPEALRDKVLEFEAAQRAGGELSRPVEQTPAAAASPQSSLPPGGEVKPSKSVEKPADLQPAPGAEIQDVGGGRAGSTEGSPNILRIEKQPNAAEMQVKSPADRKKVAKGHWAVVELSQLSHGEGLQERDRGRAASAQQVEGIYKQFDADELGDSVTTSSGAPVVTEDGRIMAGYGRSEVLRKVWGNADQRQAAYRDFLTRKTGELGLDSSWQGMKEPVLVRVATAFDGATDAKEFARQSNQRVNLGFSQSENAMRDARMILDKNLVQSLAPDESGSMWAASNRDFMRGFIREIGETEAAEYLNADGSPGPELESRVKRAVLAAMMIDSENAADVVNEIVESAADYGLTPLVNGLTQGASGLVKLKNDKSQFDLSPELAKVMPRLLEAKRAIKEGKAKSAEDFFSQGDMFRAKDEEAENLAMLLLNEKSAKSLADKLKAYYNKAAQLDAEGQTEDMFGGALPTTSKLDLLRRATDNEGSTATEPQKATAAADDTRGSSGEPGQQNVAGSQQVSEGQGSGGEGNQAGGVTDEQRKQIGDAAEDELDQLFGDYPGFVAEAALDYLPGEGKLTQFEQFLKNIVDGMARVKTTDNAQVLAGKSAASQAGKLLAQLRTGDITEEQAVVAWNKVDKQGKKFAAQQARKQPKSSQSELFGSGEPAPALEKMIPDIVAEAKKLNVGDSSKKTSRKLESKGAAEGWGNVGGEVIRAGEANSVEPSHMVIEIPEVVALAQEMMQGKYPVIYRKLRLMRGQALGAMWPQGTGKIGLRSDLFDPIPNKVKAAIAKDAQAEGEAKGIAWEPIYRERLKQAYIDGEVVADGQHFTGLDTPNDAAKTAAHEFGHLVDWIADSGKTMNRGNVLGHAAGLYKYMLSLIQETPQTALGSISKKERDKLRTQARKESKKTGQPAGELYAKLLREMAQERGLITLNDVKAELVALSQWWKPFDRDADPQFTAYRDKPAELYADAFSVLFNNPAELQKRAPTFWRLFQGWLDTRTEFRNRWERVQDMIRTGKHRDALRARIRAGFAEGEKVLEESRAKRIADKGKDMRAAFDIAMIDKALPLTRLVAKYEADLDPAKNPRYAIENELYIGSVVEAYFRDFDAEIGRDLRAAGMDAADLGEWMIYNRVSKERYDKANPWGITPKRAREMLDAYSAEANATLERAAKAFYELRNKYVLSAAEDSRIWTPALMQYAKDNEAYATFNVVEYMKEEYGSGAGAHIFRQYGTLKPIMNPLTATILKDASLISAMERNKARKAAVEFLKEYYPDALRTAKKSFNGRSTVVDKPTDRNLSLLGYLEDGKFQGWYVPRALAEQWEGENSWTLEKICTLFSKVASPVRTLFTDANPRFWVKQGFEDIMNAVMHLPGNAGLIGLTGSKGYLKHFFKGLKPAFRRYLKKADPTIQAMLEGKMLISMVNRDQGGKYDATDELDKWMQSAGLDPIQREKALKNVSRFGARFDRWTGIGQAIDRAKAVGAYTWLKEHYPDMHPEEVAHIVRVAANPAFLRKGLLYGIYNNVWWFSNAAKEGWRSDIEAAKRDKGIYAWKALKYVVLPTILKHAARFGWITALAAIPVYWASSPDDEPEEHPKKLVFLELLSLISEEHMKRYNCIPLGITPEGKCVYLALPMGNQNSFLGGLVWEMLNFFTGQEASPTKVIAGIADWTAGEAPSFNAVAKTAGELWDVAANKNPYDNFLEREVYDQNVFDAGGKELLEAVAKRTWNNMGGTVLMRFKSDHPGAIRGELEKALDIPVIGTFVGSVLKISDRGIADTARRATAPVLKEEAKERLAARDVAQKILNKEELSETEIATFYAKDQYIKDILKKASSDRNGGAWLREMSRAPTVKQRLEVYNAMRKHTELVDKARAYYSEKE